MNIQFSEDFYNPGYRPLLYDDADIIVLRGGAGSGKSWFIAQMIVRRMLSEFGFRAVGIRKVAATLRESVFSQIKDLFEQYDYDGKLIYDLSPFFDVNATFMTIKCPEMNSEIIFIGVDNPEKVKSLKQIHLIWYEEPTELDENDYRQLSLRLRGKSKAKLQQWFSFNPVDEQMWVKNEFYPTDEIDNALYDKMEKRIRAYEKKGYDYKPQYKDVAVRIVKNIKVRTREIPITYTVTNYSYFDNFFLDDVYLARLEDLKHQDRNFYNIYCLSRWGSIGDRVFDPPFPILNVFPKEFDEVIYGLDFGYHHPSALMKIGILDDAYYVTEKIYIHKKTTQELIELVQSMQLVDDPRSSPIYCDNSVTSFVREFEEAGFNVIPAEKGPDTVLKGIDTMKAAKIYSHKDNVNFNKEVRVYCWQTDPKTGKPITKPVPIIDDAISAVRYAIFTHKNQPRQHFGTIDAKKLRMVI